MYKRKEIPLYWVIIRLPRKVLYQISKKRQPLKEDKSVAYDSILIYNKQNQLKMNTNHSGDRSSVLISQCQKVIINVSLKLTPPNLLSAVLRVKNDSSYVQ